MTWRLWVLAALLPLLVEGRALLSPHPFWGRADNGDTLAWCAARSFEASQLRQGVLPLWNPYLLNGVPWQTGPYNLLHPGTLLQFLPSTVLFKVTLWASLTLACGFMTGLLRWWGMDDLPSFVGGAVYAHSGFPLAHLYAGHLDVVITLAWAPLFLWAMLAGRWLYGALALALLVSSGHYPMVYLTVWTTLLLTFRRWRVWIPVLILGLGLSAAQLLPVVENLFTVLNRGNDAAYFTSFGVPLRNLLTLLVPHVFEEGAVFVVPWPVWEGYLFFTVTGLMVMAAGVNRRTAPFVAVALLGGVLAFSSEVLQLYAWVDPLVSRFRAPGRFLFAAHLVAPFLLASGLGRASRFGAFLVGGYAVAFLWLHVGGPGFEASVGPMRFKGLLVTTYVRVLVGLVFAGCAWAALRRPRVLAGLVLLELVVFASSWMVTAAPGRFELHPGMSFPPGAYRVAWETRWANLGPARGISEVGGYVPMATSAYSRAWGKSFIANFVGVPSEAFARLQGVRFWVEGPAIKDDSTARGRAFVLSSVEVVADPIERAVRDGVVSSSVPLVLEGPVVPVRDLVLGANRVTCVAGGGLLVLTDAWAPGWGVRVDGGPAELLSLTAGLHRGVVLGPGSHRVEFAYWPKSLTVGLWVSLASLLLVVYTASRQSRQEPRWNRAGNCK